MRTARSISLSGVLLLCICFFLPQVQGCKEDVVPVVWTVDSSGVFLVTWGLPFLFAFVAAVFLGLRRLARSEGAAKWVARSACLIAALLLACSAYIMFMGSVVWHPEEGTSHIDGPWGFAAACALLGQAVFAVLLLVLAKTRTKMPVCFFCCAVSALVYFAYIGGFVAPPLFGLWVSILACVLIAAGSLLEVLKVRLR